jgi:hypothetical protein
MADRAARARQRRARSRRRFRQHHPRGFRQQYCPPGMLGWITASISGANFGAIPIGSRAVAERYAWVADSVAMTVILVRGVDETEVSGARSSGDPVRVRKD